MHFRWAPVALLAILASCSKQELVPEETPATPEPERIHILEVFPGDETKTAVAPDGGGYSVSWTPGDQLAVYEIVDGVLSPLQKSVELEEGGATNSFVFNLTAKAGSSYQYTFIYPADALSTGGSATTFQRVSIPARQIFGATSWDPAADLLRSETLELNAQPSSLNLRFERIGATAKMQLTGLSTTEVIRKVRFSTTEGNIAGYRKIDVATGDINDVVYSGDKRIDLIPESSNLLLSGDVDIWFRLYALTLTNNFTVEVETDKARYTKTVNLAAAGREIVFGNDELTTFKVNLSKGTTRIDKSVGTAYTLASSLESGQIYIFVGRYSPKDSPSSFAAMGTVNGTRRNAVEVISAEEGFASDALPESILVPDGVNVNQVRASGAGSSWSFYDLAYNKYLAYDSGLVNSESSYVWNVSFTDGIPTITGGGKTLSPNLSANYFGAYNGIQTNNTLLLYKLDPVGISFPEASYSMMIGTDEYSVFTGQTVTKGGSDARAVTYTLTGTAIGTVNSSTGVVSLNGATAGTATITASVPAGGNYIAGSVSYTVTILPQPTPTVGNDWLELPANYIKGNISSTTPSTLSDLRLITHKAKMGSTVQRNYTLLYDPETYASFWVAYPLCKDHLTTGRKDSWAYDPEVPTEKQTNCTGGAYGVSIKSDNYTSQYYARGHQIPNADRNNVAAMQAQTYYMTNITPQIQFGFNGGIWSDLEGAVRNVAKNANCDTVYVVTGAAFKKVGSSETVKTITNTRDSKVLPVPNYYWKVLLKVRRNGSGEVTNASAIGFWLDHREYIGESYTSYKTSVDQIEAWTGFDFFTNLSAALQTSAESNTNWSTFQSFSTY